MTSDRDISRQGRGGDGKTELHTQTEKEPSWSFSKLVNETRRSEDHCETVTNQYKASFSLCYDYDSGVFSV